MTIAALIPCYNEEKTLKRTVHSCIVQTELFDQIILIDDGSSDHTRDLMYKLKEDYPQIELVLLTSNSGNKSYAQEIGLTYVKSDFFVTVDADTELDPDYNMRILELFDKQPECAAISGYVESRLHNNLTACRAIDYFFVQQIIKRAQSILGFVYIIPGCAGAFRTQFFRENIIFTHDTVTEDLDFTYRIADAGAKVSFSTAARVYTDDPRTIECYRKQMRRWYRGTWQCFTKHIWSLLNRPLATFFVTLMMCESILFLTILFITIFINASYLFLFFITQVVFAFIIACIAAITTKRWDLLLAAPIYPFIQMLNILLFTEQGILHLVTGKKELHWHKPIRY